MYRVVFDVNVLVSSLITSGKSKELWLRARANRFVLILSSEIISEFISVISRGKFTKYVEERDIELFLEALNRTARFTRIRSDFKVIREDPADDIILRTAYNGKADYIVSGDRHLLSLREFRGMRIVTAGEMLKLVEKQG